MFYSLSIYKENDYYYSELYIFGFQTNQHILAKVTGNQDFINLRFKDYFPDNVFETYEKGEILLSLKKDDTELITYWGELQPMLIDTKSGAACFYVPDNE